MNYIFMFILLLPVKWLLKLFQQRSHRNLVIQTAKIGDFVNITPLLACLQKSDALLSRVVSPLADRDSTLNKIWYIEDYKGSFINKLWLALRLINRYDPSICYNPTIQIFFMQPAAMPLTNNSSLLIVGAGTKRYSI